VLLAPKLADDAFERMGTPRPVTPRTITPRPVSPAVSEWELRADKDPAGSVKPVLDLTDRAERFVLKIKNGLFHTANDELWNTEGEEAKFVMRRDTTIVGSTKFRENGLSVHHSSFTREPVATAGLAVVKEGVLKYLICDSGHYGPTPRMMAQFLRKLKSEGVALEGVLVGFHDANPDEFVWVRAEDALHLTNSTPLGPLAVTPGPDRSGKKAKSVLSRSSTHSTLAASIYERRKSSIDNSGGLQRSQNP